MWRRHAGRYLFLLALLFVWQTPAAAAEARKGAPSLAGRLLVADPGMRDTRFRKSVVIVIEHDERGAAGLIVNKTFGSGPLADIMEGFGLDTRQATGKIELHYGGPVRQSMAFVLHSGDYTAPDSRKLAGEIYFSTDIGILDALAAGKGPRRYLFATGYALWQPGQLESELERKFWKVMPATEEFVFGEEPVNAWDRLSGDGQPI
jgi:putative transcriptional regulator